MREKHSIFSDRTVCLLCLYKAGQMPVLLDTIEEWAAIVERRIDVCYAYEQEGKDYYLVSKVYSFKPHDPSNYIHLSDTPNIISGRVE